MEAAAINAKVKHFMINNLTNALNALKQSALIALVMHTAPNVWLGITICKERA